LGFSRRVVNLQDMHEQHSYIDNGDLYWDSSTFQDSPISDMLISYSVYETVAKTQNHPFFPKHIWDKIPQDIRMDIVNHDWSSLNKQQEEKQCPSCVLSEFMHTLAAVVVRNIMSSHASITLHLMAMKTMMEIISVHFDSLSGKWSQLEHGANMRKNK
jgi:hypothetical protein